MKNDRLIDLGLTGYEELFMSTEERLDAKKPKVEAIPLAALTPFRNHPFKVKEDEPLPSIRALAKDLRISVITTKRAYDELLQAGYVYAVAGKGYFVAPRNVELLREENLRRIEAHLTEVAKLAASCDLTREDVFNIYDVLSGEETV